MRTNIRNNQKKKKKKACWYCTVFNKKKKEKGRETLCVSLPSSTFIQILYLAKTTVVLELTC